MFKNKDTSLIILSKLNDKDLLSVCLVNKDANKLCQDEKFWRNRFIAQYGEADYQFMKDKVKNWRNFMLSLIKYLDLAEKKAFQIFGNKYSFRISIAMSYAIKDGRKDLVEFFASKMGELSLTQKIVVKSNLNYLMIKAAKRGHKDLVEFFISKGADNWKLGMKYAAKGGHEDLVKFFESKMYEKLD